MAGTTTNLALPYPELTDAADIEQAVKPLAEALDDYLVTVDQVLTDAERLALVSPPAGLKVFTSDTFKQWVYSGAAWHCTWQRDPDVYTPSLLNTGRAAISKTVDVADYSRNGPWIELEVRCTATATSAGVGAQQISLPVNCDTDGTNKIVQGVFWWQDTSDSNKVYSGAPMIQNGSAGFVSGILSAATGLLTNEIDTGDVVGASIRYKPV